MADYDEALKAAGFNVIAYERFGSYQGTWIVRVNEGFIKGSYGSCNGCDAMKAEFGWSIERDDPTYQEKLKKFGESYKEEVQTYEEIVKELTIPEYAWNYPEQKEQLDWVEKHK